MNLGSILNPHKNEALGSLVANVRTRVRPNKCVHIKRSIKGQGSVTVAKNQEVAPHDILGQYRVTGGFTVINLAKELNVNPKEGLKFLQKGIGQKIFKGELLASKVNMLSKNLITSPTDCILDSYDPTTGDLRLRFIPKEQALTAGVFGVVDEIDAIRGEVLIRTLATEVFGIFGSGDEKDGFLNVIAGPGDLVNASKINETHKGQVVVAGALILGETLRKAFSLSLKGIVCGGLNLDEYISLAGSLYPQRRLGSEVGITVMATEGFGLQPIGSDIYTLLQKNHGKFVLINGNTGRLLLPYENPDSILTLRKIRLPITKIPETSPEVQVSEIKVGMRVRLIWPPFMGSQGVVQSIDKTLTKLESGLTTYMLTVEIPNKKIKVPYPNIEIIL